MEIQAVNPAGNPNSSYIQTAALFRGELCISQKIEESRCFDKLSMTILGHFVILRNKVTKNPGLCKALSSGGTRSKSVGSSCTKISRRLRWLNCSSQGFGRGQ